MIYKKMSEEAYLKHTFACTYLSNVVQKAYGEETDHYYDSDLVGYAAVNASKYDETYFIEIEGHTCLPIRIFTKKETYITKPQYTMRMYSKRDRLNAVNITTEMLERLKKGDIPSLVWMVYVSNHFEPSLVFEDEQ